MKDVDLTAIEAAIARLAAAQVELDRLSDGDDWRAAFADAMRANAAALAVLRDAPRSLVRQAADVRALALSLQFAALWASFATDALASLDHPFGLAIRAAKGWESGRAGRDVLLSEVRTAH